MAEMELLDTNFRYGWNTDSPSILISDDELALADNAVIMNRGGIRKRYGTSRLNPTSFNAYVEQVIEWPRDDGTFVLLAVLNDGNEINLCRITEEGEAVPVQNLNSTRIAYFFLFDKFYFIDPGTEYYVYNGTTCNPVTPAPESDNNLEPIKRCKYAVYHSKSNRIFFAGDSEEQPAVYYSEYNNPEYVKAISVVYPTRADGPVKGLAVLMDALIVGYRFSNWVWMGIDPAYDAIWERLPTSHGPLNGDCFALTTDSLSMVSEGGIFALSPAILGLAMEAEPGSGYIMNIAKDKVLNVLHSITAPEKVKTVFNSDTGEFFIAYCDDDSGRNNKILTFDWELRAFSRYEGLKVNDFCLRQNGELLLATENYILKLDKDSQEDIGPDGIRKVYNFHIKTAKYNFGSVIVKKRVSRIFVIFRNFGELHELKVRLIVDDEPKQEFVINGDNSGKDVLVFRQKTSHVGNNFQLEIENTQYYEVEIYGIGFYYSYVDADGVKI